MLICGGCRFTYCELYNESELKQINHCITVHRKRNDIRAKYIVAFLKYAKRTIRRSKKYGR